MTNTIREPAVAGQFYPGSRNELVGMVDDFLSAADIEAAPEQVCALIAPHAGYIFSGPTAGYAYARVRGKQPERVVLLGGSHRYPLRTLSLPAETAFSTPAGTFPVDKDIVDRITDDLQTEVPEAHAHEHSLEVQLPFLAAVFGEVPIVPILFGPYPGTWHAQFGAYLSEIIDKNDLVIASTDMSHYLSEEQANTLDKHTLSVLMQQDWHAFAEGINNESCSMCGATAVIVAMTYAQACGANDWMVLDRTTSAKTAHDYRRVVGYAAISMEYGE